MTDKKRIKFDLDVDTAENLLNFLYDNEAEGDLLSLQCALDSVLHPNPDAVEAGLAAHDEFVKAWKDANS